MNKHGWWVVASLAVVLFGLCEDAFARSRPPTKYCLRGPTGGTACLYNTIEQCRLAASGTGGACRRNPHDGRR